MTDDTFPAVSQSTKPPRPLPGDKTEAQTREAMIRVDHAGEYGAVRIYAGQRAVMGESHSKAGLLRHMHAQEEVHLDRFNTLMAKRGVRPTVLTPLWHMAGYALGAATALMGEKAAMACTAAVEEVIDEHYEEQRVALKGKDAELEEMIETFQAEEVEHLEIAKAHGAEDATGYPLLSGVIKAGCKAAIWISKRV